jgi:hypothetical protein
MQAAKKNVEAASEKTRNLDRAMQPISVNNL